MQDFNPDDFNPEDNESPDDGNTYSTGCVAGCDELADCIRRRPSGTDCRQEYQACAFGCDRSPVRRSDP